MKDLLKVIAAKIESTYGTNSVPTPTADFMPVEDLEWQLGQALDDYNPASNTFGEGHKVVAENWGTLKYKVPVTGGGTPLGTAPFYGKLFRACGMAETLNASVSAVYSLVSTGEASLSQLFNHGGFQHLLLGSRGNVSFVAEADKVPRFGFDFMGLHSTPTDVALPAPTLPSNLQARLAMNRSNTTFTLNGVSYPLQRLEIDLGVKPEYRNLANVEDVQLMGRVPKGKAVVELLPVAGDNLFSRIEAGTATVMNFTHGVAGNRFALATSNVQALNPRKVEIKGHTFVEVDLHFPRVEPGNNEMTFTFT